MISFFSLQETIIGGLLPETTYSVSIAAYTTKGDGARSKAKVIATTGAGKPFVLQYLLMERPTLLSFLSCWIIDIVVAEILNLREIGNIQKFYPFHLLSKLFARGSEWN